MNLPRNVIFNFLSWLLPLIVTIKFTPIIVHGLGTNSYGIYALVTGFIAYSFYFAISRAIPVYVAEYRVKNQIEKVGEVVTATLVINVSIGLCACLFFLFASDWLVTSALHISPGLQRAAKISFYLAGVSVLFLMMSQVFSSIPQALHRFDIYSSITVATTILLQVGNVLLVIAGKDVVSLFIWNLILLALNFLAYWFVAKRLLPEAKLSFSFPRSLLWSIIKYSGGVMAYQGLANLLLIFERGWLARTSGGEALAFYAVPMTIALCIHTFIGSLAMIVFPLATEANAEQNKERLQAIYTRSLKLLNCLIVFIVITLCVCSHQLLTVWMGKDFAAHSSTVLFLQAISFGVLAFIVVTWSLVDGLGHPWLNALLVFTWTCVAVPMMIWLTPKYGAIGSAYGRFFSVLVIPVYALVIERWIFKKNFWAFWGKMVLWLSFFGSLAGLIEHFVLSKVFISWLTIGLAVFISGLIYCAGLWFTPYFDPLEKDWILRLGLKKQEN